MTFTPETFQRVGARTSYASNAQHWTYKTADSKTTIESSGYFNKFIDKLNIGDIVDISIVTNIGDTTEALSRKITYSISTMTSGVVTIVEQISGSTFGIVNVKDYGAVGDGTTDDSPAFTAALAIGKDVLVPSGDFRVQNLVIPDGQTLFGHGNSSILRKRANGPIVSLGERSHLRSLSLYGEGAFYTGPGVLVPSTGEYHGGQRISNCWIIGSATYPVEYAAEYAGFMSTIVQCELAPHVPETYACVKWGVETALNHHGDRAIIGCGCQGFIVDARGSNAGYVAQCFSGAPPGYSGPLCAVITDANTKTLTVTGCRLVGPQNFEGINGTWTGNIISLPATIGAGASNLTITGNVIAGGLTVVAGAVKQCTITGNSINGDLVIGSGTVQSRFANNFVATGVVTDNSGSVGVWANEVDIPRTSYTPTWTAASGTPNAGTGGSLTGFYSRSGRRVTVELGLVFGTSPTLGTGDWTFGVPISSSYHGIGPVHIFDAGTRNYTGVAHIESGQATFKIYEQNTVGAANPHAWAVNDYMNVTLAYDI